MVLLGKQTSIKNIEANSSKNFGEFVRIGFVITKKIDKRATVRNRIRRRIKAVLRTILLNHCNLYRCHTDYVLIVLENLSSISYADLLCIVEKLFSKFKMKYDK
jgi:ribonuclease P protein component